MDVLSSSFSPEIHWISRCKASEGCFVFVAGLDCWKLSSRISYSNLLKVKEMHHELFWPSCFGTGSLQILIPDNISSE